MGALSVLVAASVVIEAATQKLHHLYDAAVVKYSRTSSLKTCETFRASDCSAHPNTKCVLTAGQLSEGETRSWSRVTPPFMKLEASLTCSQEPSTRPYPELSQSSP